MTQQGRITLHGLKLKALKGDFISDRVQITLTATLNDELRAAHLELQKMHTLDYLLDVALQPQASQLTFEKDPFA